MAESRDGGRPARGVSADGPPLPALRRGHAVGKQGDAARTVYWCPRAKRGKEPGGA